VGWAIRSVPPEEQRRTHAEATLLHLAGHARLPLLRTSMREWVFVAEDSSGLQAVLVVDWDDDPPEVHLWARDGVSLRDLDRAAAYLEGWVLGISGLQAYILVEHRAARWLALRAGFVVDPDDPEHLTREPDHDGQLEAEAPEGPSPPGAGPPAPGAASPG
jgi:hypothetical protein